MFCTQHFLDPADKKDVRALFICLLILGLLMGYPAQAGPFSENVLMVYIAKKTLREVLKNIALSIGEIKGDFPQLKKWHRAQIFSDRIEYRDRHCNLLIFSKEEPILNENSERPMELKVGVYLKMKAVGERTDLLKQTLLEIISRHFEKIRVLRLLQNGN